MFQSAKRRMALLLDVVDDMLVGAPPEDDPPAELEAPHPHRRPASVRRPGRRRGEVSARPMVCLSPLRPASPAGAPARDVVADR